MILAETWLKNEESYILLQIGKLQFDAYISGLKEAKGIAERNEKFTDIKVSELIGLEIEAVEKLSKEKEKQE